MMLDGERGLEIQLGKVGGKFSRTYLACSSCLVAGVYADAVQRWAGERGLEIQLGNVWLQRH